MNIGEHDILENSMGLECLSPKKFSGLQLTTARSSFEEMGYLVSSEPPTQRPREFLQFAQSEKLLSTDFELSVAFVEEPLGK